MTEEPCEECGATFTGPDAHIAIVNHVSAVHIHGVVASEPAEPTTRQAMIDKAAYAICDAYEAYAPVPGVLRSEAPNIARALADLGLLADPAQTTELERLRFLNGEAEHVIARALDELRERTAERDRLGAQLDAARLNASDAERTAEELRGVRDALSLLLRGMARKLVNYRKWMSGDDVPVVHRLRREAEERQARIDAVLAIRDQPNNVAPRHDFSAGWKHAIDAVRAALAGDQPMSFGAAIATAGMLMHQAERRREEVAVREALSGAALRDVEEADDAAGDLP